MQSLTVQIPKPCHERWDAMQPTEQGRFCAHCRKTVVDYTALSDRELARVLNQASGDICGRLRTEQLNRALLIPAQATHPIWRHWVSLLAMGLFSGQTAQAQAKPPIISQHQSTQLNRPGDERAVQDSSQISKTFVSGQVFCTGANGILESLPGATIQLKGTSWRTYTNAHGSFMLSFSGERETQITLIVSFVGYKNQEIIASSTQKLSIILDEDMGQLTGEVVVTNYRSSRWQRFKQKLFHRG